MNKPMFFRLLSDLVLILHFAFIVFVVVGAFLALLWRWIWILHFPAVIWGVLIVFLNFSCPLTSLESYLRASGGGEAYKLGFIEYYFTMLVYPEITQNMQLAAGVLLIAVNLGIYLYVFYPREKQET